MPPLQRIQMHMGIHYARRGSTGGELTGEALTIGKRVQALAEPGEDLRLHALSWRP